MKDPNQERQVAEYEKLQSRHKEITQKLAMIDGQRKEQEKQLHAIFTKHSVSSVEELKAKCDKAKSELDAEMKQASEYVEKSAKALSDLEAVLAASA